MGYGSHPIASLQKTRQHTAKNKPRCSATLNYPVGLSQGKPLLQAFELAPFDDVKMHWRQHLPPIKLDKILQNGNKMLRASAKHNVP